MYKKWLTPLFLLFLTGAVNPDGCPSKDPAREQVQQKIKELCGWPQSHTSICDHCCSAPQLFPSADNPCLNYLREREGLQEMERLECTAEDRVMDDEGSHAVIFRCEDSRHICDNPRRPIKKDPASEFPMGI